MTAELKATRGPWVAVAGTTTGRQVIAPEQPKVRRNVAAVGGQNREANAALTRSDPEHPLSSELHAPAGVGHAPGSASRGGSGADDVAALQAENERLRERIETLRRALAWHGDWSRMATTREDWQQEIDEGLAWVQNNPEPGHPIRPSLAEAAEARVAELEGALREIREHCHLQT